MARLYRSSLDLEHWYVYLDTREWFRLPAKSKGWLERRSVAGLQPLGLLEVPLWLAFGTGLLEAQRREAIVRAA